MFCRPILANPFSCVVLWLVLVCQCLCCLFFTCLCCCVLCVFVLVCVLFCGLLCVLLLCCCCMLLFVLFVLVVRWTPSAGPQLRRTPLRRTAQNFALFSLSRHFSFSSPSLVGRRAPLFSGFGPTPFRPHHDTHQIREVGWPKLVSSCATTHERDLNACGKVRR